MTWNEFDVRLHKILSGPLVGCIGIKTDILAKTFTHHGGDEVRVQKTVFLFVYTSDFIVHGRASLADQDGFIKRRFFTKQFSGKLFRENDSVCISQRFLWISLREFIGKNIEKRGIG